MVSNSLILPTITIFLTLGLKAAYNMLSTFILLIPQNPSSPGPDIDITLKLWE